MKRIAFLSKGTALRMENLTIMRTRIPIFVWSWGRRIAMVFMSGRERKTEMEMEMEMEMGMEMEMEI
jgi:hypothetical protein